VTSLVDIATQTAAAAAADGDEANTSLVEECLMNGGDTVDHTLYSSTNDDYLLSHDIYWPSDQLSGLRLSLRSGCTKLS